MNILLYLRIVLIHCIKFDHKDLEKSEILTEEIKLQSSKRERERERGGGGLLKIFLKKLFPWVQKFKIKNFKF